MMNPFKDPASIKVIKSSAMWAALLLGLYLFQRYLMNGEFIGNYIADHREIYLSATVAFFAMYCGKIEAYLYYYKMKATENLSKEEERLNLHPMFVVFRFFVFLLVTYHGGLLLAALLVLTFPFFHDGAYYAKRYRQRNISFAMA